MGREAAAVSPSGPIPRCWRLWPAAFAAMAVLFACYLRLSRTLPMNSDGASNALQAWDMLHGNLLLRGWHLSDVSFYPTELPQYMLIELVRGLTGDVVHVGGAMTYTLLVLLAALLAKGQASGREGAGRMLIAGGIMLAPEPGNGTLTLLLSPDHVGTQVPVLLTWLIVDRAPPRWYVPAGVGVLLALAEVADTAVLYLAVIPLVIVCALRVQRGFSERLAAQWYDLALAAAAIASVGLARLCVALIQHYGGYVAATPRAVFAPFYSVPGHFWIAVGGVLQLYGAYFFGQPVGWPAIGALLHLVGLGLAGWAVVLAARRLFRETDRIVGVLALALLANLLAYVLSTNVTSLASTRDIAAVLPIGAVLAGRLLAGRLSRARLPLSAAALGYAVCLGAGMAQPSVPGDNQLLATWLAAHHFSYGLAGYWQASSVTLESGGRVQVRPFTVRAGRVVPGPWELKPSWYDAGLNRANFVVLFHGGPDMNPFAPAAQVLATFGPAARSYQTGPYQILVWNKNLLAEVRRG